MSGPIVIERQHHPQNIRITDALQEDASRLKAQKGIVSKRATLVTAGISDDEMQKLVGGTMTPSDDQLNRINQFTRRSVGAEEVVAFNTLSCNDLEDRDIDQFTTDCVMDFASLEQPFSPVGKSYLVDHQHSVNNAVGRIFGVGTEKVGGNTFLTNEVYLPNTAQFEPLIEKIDFGIAWAVSVGVVLGKSACSVCGEGFSSWGYWCREGHDKGSYYDPNDQEEDNLGWPIPVEPGTKGAIKCVREFSDPRDFYELSQVFLGAQYHAALEDKSPEMASALKTAGSNSFVGASQQEARELPLRHEPERLSEARLLFDVSETEDGSLTWVDDDQMVWAFDTEDPESGVLCLGKQAHDKSEEDDEDADTEHEVRDEQLDSDADAEDSEDEPSVEVDGSEDSEDHDDEEAAAVGSEEGKDPLSKTDVLKAAKRASLDDWCIKTVEESEGNGLDDLLAAFADKTGTLRTANKALTEKAELGDVYLKELRSDALNWYVKARLSPDVKAVSTDTFERMLDRFGDDVDLFRSVIEENKSLAQAKFPEAVRRSSFPVDPHERGNLDEPSFESDSDERVKRIHG